MGTSRLASGHPLAVNVYVYAAILPGTDGIELMQTVPELADLPVIFISGYGRDVRRDEQDETASRAALSARPGSSSAPSVSDRAP